MRPEPADAIPTVHAMRAARVVAVCAALLAVIGATVLVGWGFEIEALRSVGFGGVTMNPTTGGCFLVLAAGLVATLRPGVGAELLRTVLGVGVIVVGLARIARDDGVPVPALDELAFAARLHGSRMAPNVALAFILLGVALSSFDSTALRFDRLSRWLVLGAAIIAWLAILGYTFGNVSLYGVRDRVPMALGSAVALIIASAGLACARPDRQPVALLTSDSAGGVLARRLFPFALLAPLLVGIGRLEGQRHNVFSVETGVSIMVGAMSGALVAAVFWCGQILQQLDAQRKETERRVRELSLTDELTGLRNRRGFLELARQQLLVARRHKQPTILCYMDLDGLKGINDVQGHAVGDRAIKAFGSVLRRIFRESDILARLGGDEFVVLAINSSESVRFETKVRDELQRYNATAGEPFELAASMGLTTCQPDASLDVESLLQLADEEMYAQKSSRRRSFSGRRESAAAT